MSKSQISKWTHWPFDSRRWSFAICLLSLLVLLVPVIQPLLTANFTRGADNGFHLWRAVQVERLLRGGILFSRWAPDMAHGFGYPLFVFHSPFSAYVAAVLRLSGLSWPIAVNATFVVGIVLGGLFAFFLARDLFGLPAGLVAGVAYVYAPYQAYDAFNRGSMSEVVAWAFLPLVLWATHRWSAKNDARFFTVGTLGLAVLVLTHQLFAFLFAPLLAAWVIVASIVAHDWRVIGRGAAQGLVGVGLSAFFWLPGLAERGWVQTDRLLGTWVFEYENNFLKLAELLAIPRVVDLSLINDRPPKALGLVPALVALLPLVNWRRMRWATRWQTAMLLALLAGFSFMTLPSSRLLWDHLPLLPYIQFPWRFLGPAALCAALLAAIAVSGLRARISTLGSGVLIALLTLTSLGWFYPDHQPPPSDISIAGMIAWERATDTLGTTAKGEYLPVWVHRFPEEPVLETALASGDTIVRLPAESLPEGTRVLRADYGPLEATIELVGPTSFRARYLAFYFPGWRVHVDGEAVAIAPTDPDGLVSFDVPAGRHTIHVGFGETPLRLLADVVSLLSLALLVALALCRLLPASRRSHMAACVSQSPVIQHRAPILLTITTLLFLAALALNLSPHLRGPDEWRWAYAVPGNPARLWISALALSLYLLLAFAWIRHATSRASSTWQHWVLLPALMLAVPLIQASLLALGHSDILKPLFYRTISPGASGVFSVGSTIEYAGDFLRRYPTLMPTFPVHPQRYPPGLPLLFYLVRRLLETAPALADAIGFRLRLYQCHEPSLMRLSNATISTATLQMALPLVSGLTLLPLYRLAQRVGGRHTAAWTVALYPLVSSFALWSARWDQFYPLLAVTAWYLLHLGLTENRLFAVLAAGLTLSAASLLSFSVVALLLPMGIFAVLWVLAQPTEVRNLRSAVCSFLVFLFGLASPWVIYRLAFGTGFLDIWRVSMSFHLGLDRGHGTWLAYHLYDFFVFLGVPLALLFLVALVRATYELARYAAGRLSRPALCWCLPRPSVHPTLSAASTLTLGLALGLLVLDLSGTSRGEVARVWLFLTPFAALVAAHGLALLHLGPRGRAVVAILLALQLLTFNAFLRVVTTGLSDPPSRARRFDLDRVLPSVTRPLSARFYADGAEAIALLGYDIEPEMPLPGETLRLTLYWQSLRPLAGRYTVFTHLVGPDDQLVGQQDNMPLRDTAPTTCWIPGEIIADPYDIVIASEATEGTYSLETGFYSFPTGERLPVTGPRATPDQRVVVTSVSIGER